MGALIPRLSSYQIRNWLVERKESYDPTDGFGTVTVVFVVKNQIVQIEPDTFSKSGFVWITDKARYFYDSIFDTLVTNDVKESYGSTTVGYEITLKNLSSVHYINEVLKSKCCQSTVVLGNAGLESIVTLVMMQHLFSFLKLRLPENTRVINDFESDVQLNSINRKFDFSTLCMIISTNPRFEGSTLNLSLRKRFLKGNFQCILIGSLLNLTFSTIFKGSNLRFITTTAQGKNIFCKIFRWKVNPLMILNKNFFKRTDSFRYLKIIKLLKTMRSMFLASQSMKPLMFWNSISILMPTLQDGGTHSFFQIPKLDTKDLELSNFIYLINLPLHNFKSLKTILNSKILNYNHNFFFNSIKTFKSIIIDQKSTYNLTGSSNFFKPFKFTTYFHLPSSTFYANQETFLSTDGFFKKTYGVVFKKNLLSDWQLIRKFLQYTKINNTFLNFYDSALLFYSSRDLNFFRDYINLHYLAVKSLTSFNFFFKFNNKPFYLNVASRPYKAKAQKMLNSKVKFWLDDFFCGGQDGYSHESRAMAYCSNLTRDLSTSFNCSSHLKLSFGLLTKTYLRSHIMPKAKVKSLSRKKSKPKKKF
jgi:hypothetical protein